MANSNYFENYSYFTVIFPIYGRQNSWCSANLMSVFINNYYSRCTGCDGIHFFHSSVYAAVFWFMTETVLVAHQCFGYCRAVPAQHQGCLFFSLLCTPSWPGDTARTADPDYPKTYSVPSVTCSGVKAWGREKRGGDVCGCGICLPE